MKRSSSQIFALIVLAFVVVACGPSDEKISADVTEALKTNPELSTVSSTVKEGVVTLTG